MDMEKNIATWEEVDAMLKQQRTLGTVYFSHVACTGEWDIIAKEGVDMLAYSVPELAYEAGVKHGDKHRIIGPRYVKFEQDGYKCVGRVMVVMKKEEPKILTPGAK